MSGPIGGQPSQPRRITRSSRSIRSRRRRLTRRSIAGWTKSAAARAGPRAWNWAARSPRPSWRSEPTTARMIRGTTRRWTRRGVTGSIRTTPIKVSSRLRGATWFRSWPTILTTLFRRPLRRWARRSMPIGLPGGMIPSAATGSPRLRRSARPSRPRSASTGPTTGGPAWAHLRGSITRSSARSPFRSRTLPSRTTGFWPS